MRNMSLLIIVCCSIVSATALDSLVSKSESGRIRAHRQPGFIQLQYMPLIPLTSPDKLFAMRDSIKDTTRDTNAILRPLYLSRNFQYVTIHEYDKDMEQLDNRILETKTSLNKVTTILENLQSQSDSHRKNLDFVVKVIEGLVALIGAISTLIATMYGLKKKKKSTQ